MELNREHFSRGTPAGKRKHSGSPAFKDRPSKHMRETDSFSDDDSDLEVDMISPDASALTLPLGIEPERLLPATALADSAEWQRTIESVVRNVVSIRFCQTCSFDTDSACTSEATGFVVDAEKGYIMTNRHVVSSGPFWGYCVFDNHEECDAYPVYRDPIHDFGILRFNPKDIKYMPVAALQLRPDLAKVGTEIRVVGNDAGEKLSILSGIISRVDRNAPDYGEGYNDFNTNYIQAAASASGGSSGSPVVNIDGYAVALQAGGSTEAATDYFLPLDRPLRALQCIQAGKPVARGTIQTQWLTKPFDECRRLGLTPAWEDVVRKGFPKEVGMLVAETVLPEGPGHEHIEEGDILLKVNGELLTKFVRLDEILDDSVGQTVKLLISRGGQDIEVELTVGDLHAISPDRFLVVCGAAFHNLSYQAARLYAIAVKGVYVCEPAGSFRFDGGADSGWIIESVDNQKTPSLNEFIEVMKTIPDRARIVVTYRHLRDLHTMHTSILHIDRHWTSKMRMAIRNDTTGLWDYEDIADPLPPQPVLPQKAQFIRLDHVSQPCVSDLIRCFVRVSCAMPLKLDGFPKSRKSGFGLVVDAEKGLVIVSRAIVPYDLCDVSVTIAESVIVEGKVLFLHPLQNYAVVQYDPKLVQAPVQSARLSEESMRQGAETIFLGFNQNLRVVVAKTSVTDITTVAVPPNSTAPRYRAINIDAITVDTNLSSQCGSGVLADEDGTVRALWLTYLGERAHGGKDVEYHLGLATPSVLPIIRQIQQGIIPQLRYLNVELHLVHMSQVRIMGASEEWIRKVEEDNPERHQLFMVRKVECGRAQVLQEGDLILSINGKIMTRITDLDVMYDKEELDVVIVRGCEEMNLRVPTAPTDDLETDRVVIFCGAVLHRPHHAVRQQISKMHSEIYVSARTRGSPAYQYQLVPTNFILAVNGVKTQDLDSFLAEVSRIPDNTYFRLKVMTFDNVPFVISIKKNEHYFPTMEFIKQGDGWKRQTYDGKSPHEGLESNMVAEIMDEVAAYE
ncbi:trypsin-like cysteine/serine peptidase domain-containing protein [Tricharina praecox]|uniref:trypsin-like cysteine/serine peptidase domain-containing protein n=1 Tax=Tricharina praecox TaxID=43433 RepID=UPI00221EAB35|nr:trypsin-like cysteine/serine peptidase domain-containing protein [Tricharina praecox]KAI5858706.1 trypsin-like cysteine/serine peptidase domain-containing protein [Tricharina praecox]